MSAADRLHRYLALQARKRALDTESKEVGAEMERLQAEILDRWVDDGVTSVRVNGSTVYVRRQALATIVDGDYDRAARALREAGLEGLLRANTTSLGAFIRECEANEQPLPPSFEGAIATFERFSLGVRNS